MYRYVTGWKNIFVLPGWCEESLGYVVVIMFLSILLMRSF